jgi:hypothetical protein
LPLRGFLSSAAADLDDLLAWLESNHLTRHRNSYQEIVSAGSVTPNIALGIPAQRTKKKTRDEINPKK